MKEEIKTGKGWLKLSKEVPVHHIEPMTLENFKKMLEDLQKSVLDDYDTYWANILDNMSSTAKEQFNEYVKKEFENLPFKLKQ
jgi:hypothetical protein